MIVWKCTKASCDAEQPQPTGFHSVWFEVKTNGVKYHFCCLLHLQEFFSGWQIGRAGISNTETV